MVINNQLIARLVPEVGLEPTRSCLHMILSHACIPIPPLWPGYCHKTIVL